MHNSKSNSNIHSLTEGNPYKLILLFALPLMAGNVFQQLYTVTDTAIVGRELGVGALAALGTVEWFSWMSLGIIQGITQGFSILMAQRFGAKDEKGLRKGIGNSWILAALSAVLMLTLTQLLVNPYFIILRVPQEVRPTAELYVRIMFCGIPIIMTYNMLSSMLRALGDSKTPLYAMIVASLTNIGLDFLFVMVFHWGVAGAAIATLTAQMISALFCWLKIRKIELLTLSKQDYKVESHLARRLLFLGAPMAFQNMIIAIGGMTVMAVVNKYGVAFIAGYTASNKLYGVLEIAAVSYGFAMTTYTGQNMGAGNKERISKGVVAGNVIGISTSLVITVAMIVLGKLILSCFIDPSGLSGQEAMKVGYESLCVMSICLPILYVLHVTRSCIQGMGNTVIPMVSGFAEFTMRASSALIMPALFGAVGIYFAEPIAWLGADLILIPGYRHTRKKL